MRNSKQNTATFYQTKETKPKLLKNEIKITNSTNTKNKKPTRPVSASVSNIKKSTPSNSKPLNKRNSITSAKKQIKNPKIVLTKDQAIKIIQRAFRKYIKKVHTDPKYEYMQLLKKKKMNILKNYNIVENVKKSNLIPKQNDEDLYYFEPPVNEPKQKEEIDEPVTSNKNEEKLQTSVAKENINEISNINNTSVNKQNNSSYLDLMNQMNKELNDDLKGLSNKFMIDDIDNDIKNDYIEEEDYKKKENEKAETNNNMKDILDDIKESSKIKKEVEEKSENIYEKIFREMQKSKSSAKATEKEEEISPKVEETNNIDTVNQAEIEKPKELNESIRLKKELIQSIRSKKELNESIRSKKDKDTNIINRSQLQEEPKDKMELAELDDNKQNKTEIITKEDILSDDLIENKLKETESNEKVKITDTITKLLQNTSNIEVDKPKEKESPVKKDVYNRLNSFLDSSTQNPIPQPTPNKNSSLLDTAQNQADIIGLNLQLKEAQKTIDTLSSVITELKTQLKSKDDYLNKALLSQKNENDALLSRQNTLMESLYSEKKKMETQISELQEKLNQSEKISYKKLQTMRENYELETKKNKDAWFQAEKLRRRKWEELKIKEIKDLTAKGLEPEIEKIIANHKVEISNLEDNYRMELKTQKERLTNEFDEKVNDIKRKLQREKDDAIEHEKTLAVQRLRNQSERLEDEINEERRRWNAKLQSEITRLESLREKDKKIYDEQISKLEERNNNNIFNNENFYTKKIDDMKREYETKLQTEISNMKLQFAKENEEVLSKKQSDLEAKFKEMKLDLLKDRDKQINIVIEKLGEETLQERKQNKIEAEKKANEKNVHLIEENSALTKKLNDITEKLQAETKNRINLEQNIDILTKKLKEKEIELNKKEKQYTELTNQYSEMTDKLSGLTREFNKEKMNLEIEMKSNLQKGDAEIALLNNKLKTAHKMLEQQKEDIEAMHRKEIEEIEKKIKKTFQIKDDIIQKLQEDVELKDITIQKLEEMLNKQRQELFGK